MCMVAEHAYYADRLVHSLCQWMLTLDFVEGLLEIESILHYLGLNFSLISQKLTIL